MLLTPLFQIPYQIPYQVQRKLRTVWVCDESVQRVLFHGTHASSDDQGIGRKGTVTMMVRTLKVV